MAKAKPITISTQDLVAVAFAAYRHNNNSIQKYDNVYDPVSGDVITVTNNRQLIANTIGSRYANKDGIKLTVTEEDRVAAVEAIELIQHDCTIQSMLGKKISDFTQSVNSLISKEVASEVDAGIAVYVPTTAEKIKQRQASDIETVNLSFTSKWVGSIGKSLEINFVAIDSRFIQNYNCWSVFGHDGNGNAIQFLTSKEELIQSGRIKGKVKAHEANPYRKNASVTSLNYVKRV